MIKKNAFCMISLISSSSCPGSPWFGTISLKNLTRHEEVKKEADQANLAFAKYN